MPTEVGPSPVAGGYCGPQGPPISSERARTRRSSLRDLKSDSSSDLIRCQMSSRVVWTSRSRIGRHLPSRQTLKETFTGGLKRGFCETGREKPSKGRYIQIRLGILRPSLFDAFSGRLPRPTSRSRKLASGPGAVPDLLPLTCEATARCMILEQSNPNGPRANPPAPRKKIALVFPLRGYSIN